MFTAGAAKTPCHATEPSSRPAVSRPEGLALTTALPGLPRATMEEDPRPGGPDRFFYGHGGDMYTPQETSVYQGFFLAN